MSPDEIKKIIVKSSKVKLGKEPSDVSYLRKGGYKHVYKFHVDSVPYVALVSRKRQDLLSEYIKSQELYSGISEFFPEPMYFFRDRNSSQELFVTRFIHNLTLSENAYNGIPSNSINKRQLSYVIGRSIARINCETGYFSCDLENRNVFAFKEQGNLKVKFCDVDSFMKGDIEDCVAACISDINIRPECYRFIDRFRKGLAEGIHMSTGQDVKEAYDSLDFIRQYNDIF